MSISLYDASVANFIQTLGGVVNFLDRGLSHCTEHGLDPGEIVETRLYPDMLPFWFQIRSVAHHSIGAIEGVKRGAFSPPSREPPPDYAALQAIAANALGALQALQPEAVNALQGRDIVFQAGERRIEFVAENFLLSFSLPNFYFHAATAYGILRSKGVAIGKRDYMGVLRRKP